MKKTIGVYTKDFAVYHDLLKLLKKQKIAYVSLSSPNNFPSRIKVILTTEKEARSMSFQKTVAVDNHPSLQHAIDAALRLLVGKPMYRIVFIGIDPGERPGIAVVGDEVLLYKTFVKSPEEVAALMKRLLKEYPSKETTIRIGHGALIIRNRIINSLIPLHVPIEIVDESKTSVSLSCPRWLKDCDAAAAIAMLPGGKVQTRLPLEPTRGDIRNVQQHSRQLTNGRFSISQETARKVLEGKLSLKEAIEQEQHE